MALENSTLKREKERETKEVKLDKRKLHVQLIQLIWLAKICL